MNQEKVQLNYLRMAPRKVRRVANVIKGLRVNEAEAQLMMRKQRAAQPIIKLLRSAVANAVHNKKMDPEKLIVGEIRVDQASMLKRILPRAMGRATNIQKKMSHITLILKEIDKKTGFRFTIVTEKPKKEVKEKPAKKSTPKTETAPDSSKSKDSKGGFMKKMFRRKSI